MCTRLSIAFQCTTGIARWSLGHRGTGTLQLSTSTHKIRRVIRIGRGLGSSFLGDMVSRPALIARRNSRFSAFPSSGPDIPPMFTQTSAGGWPRHVCPLDAGATRQKRPRSPPGRVMMVRTPTVVPSHWVKGLFAFPNFYVPNCLHGGNARSASATTYHPFLGSKV
jgi:hypothetical protein